MHSVVLDSVRKIFRPGGFAFFRGRSAETYALRGLSMEVAPGEVLALLGQNGSGKSTTLKLIATVLLPDRGRVLVHGADSRGDANQIRRQVGFALASERSFYPRLTVRENLDFFAALEDVPHRERALRLNAILRDLDLEPHAGKQVMKLSSGLYQRLGIARALIKQPRVLLLDEPSRSLDPAAAHRLWTLVRKLADAGIAIVLATHNFAEAVATSDRVAVLQTGRLLGTRRLAGLSAELLQNYYLELTGEEDVLEWADEVPA